MPASPYENMKKHHIRQLYLRIADDKFHILKNILEGYDNMGLVSSQTEKSGAVLLRYPCGFEREIFELLADLARILKQY